MKTFVKLNDAGHVQQVSTGHCDQPDMVRFDEWEDFLAQKPAGGQWAFHLASLQWVEAQPDTTVEAALARDKRDRLLAGCDWTQLPDVPEQTRLVWVEYRQALRDVTSQEGFPLAISWPTPPTT